MNFNKHCKLEFGSYVQAYEEHDNSIATQTTGAIALRPTGNEQGGYYMFSLSSGKVLNRNHWTALPLPNNVIDRVHALACRFHHADMALVFADRFGTPILDIIDVADDDNLDDDSDYNQSADDDNDSLADNNDGFYVDNAFLDNDDNAAYPADANIAGRTQTTHMTHHQTMMSTPTTTTRWKSTTTRRKSTTTMLI